MAPAQRLVSRDGTLFDLDLFTFTIGVNLIGMFDVIRNVAGVMAGYEPDGNGERGIIGNVASIVAFEGQIGQAAHSASKGGAGGAGEGPAGCVAPGAGVPSAGGPVGRCRGAGPLDPLVG